MSSNSTTTQYAHRSFPLSHRLLAVKKLLPDFDYDQVPSARFLSHQLQDVSVSFSAGELFAIGVIGKAYLKILFNNQIYPSGMDGFLYGGSGPISLPPQDH